MPATTRFADHLLTGLLAARPAATAVPAGTLYAATDAGVIYQAAAGAWGTWLSLGVGGGNFTLISDVQLGSANATLCDFTSISGGYKHLELFITGRTDRASNERDWAYLTINNDTTSGHYYYMIKEVTYTGSASESNIFSGASAHIQFGTFPASTAPASWFSGAHLRLLDYANTTTYKYVMAHGGGASSTTGADVYTVNGNWLSTSAITRITVTSATSANWQAGSRATLYGIS